MNYKFLFIVTSAIIPFRVGSAHSAEERFEQTLATISSIRQKAPNSLICIAESSFEKLPAKYSDNLIELSDFYVDYFDDEVIQHLYNNLNKAPDRFSAGKSLLETRTLYNTLVDLAAVNLNVNRVFKLTGRYSLNDSFNIQDYETKFLENKYALQWHSMKNEKDHLPTLIYGIDGAIRTTLWSFDISLLNETIELYQKCFNFMDLMMMYACGINIEYAIYKFMDFSKVLNISVLGVTAICGPDGAIYEM